MNKRYLWVLLAATGLIFIAIAGIWKYKQDNKYSSTYRFPAEFEKQQAIWLQWPSEVYNISGRPVNPVVIDIIQTLSRYIRVNLIVNNTGEIILVKNRLSKSSNLARIHFYRVNHRTVWARDVGPIFIKDRHNQLHVVNFGFNNYSRGGDPYYINNESRIDWGVAGLLGLPVISSPLISEGGAIESNGKGTLMVTAAVVRKRNPGLTKKQIASEYQKALGVRKIIWLNKGLAEDDRITSGHINEIARFINTQTVLLGKVLPAERRRNMITQASYQRLEENYRILRNSTDQNGRRFRIIRIPMPPAIYGKPDISGNIPVYSYLNFVITNGAVLIPVYWRPGRPPVLKTAEERVKRLFRRLFPGREIIGINAENINLWGGGIHCITQPMPAAK